MKKALEKLIKEKSLRITAARKAILDILLSSKKPLSYDEIKSKLNIKMDKTTFYRNISKFEEKKIVHKIESENKRSYFGLNIVPHSHFICKKCGEIFCMKEDMDIKAPNGFIVDDVVLRGICKKCA